MMNLIKKIHSLLVDSSKNTKAIKPINREKDVESVGPILPEFKDARKAECPNCLKTLSKIPGAKTKCPFCAKYIFVRTRPDNVRVVVTHEEASKIDNEWSIINGVEIRHSNRTDQVFEWERGEKTPVNRFMVMVGNSCDISEGEIFARRKKFKNIDDTLWSLSQEYLLLNKKKNNYDNVISIYSFLESVRVSEDKDTNYLVKLRLYNELLRIKEERIKNGTSDFDIISIMASNWRDDSGQICPKCKELDGKELTLNEALETQPLPPDGCTCKCCGCEYL